ncbi:tetratricopeptide repeat protein [Mangrovibacterium sp.]|uniref:tetratricopeptide repeat protein n=1 Tax=Mangrovibacterium sp. TaxID=1961364 RepID=UPI00356AADDF
MERANYLTLMFCLLLCSSNVIASNKSDIYRAYIQNDMDLWQKTIDKMNQQEVKSIAFRLELLNYQYGFIAWCIGNKKSELAENYLDLGETNLTFLEKTGNYSSLVNSYKSAFYGFRIGLNRFKAPFIGPKSVDCALAAMKQDSTNPFGYIQYANSQFYRPPVFGGSKSVALEYYKKAEVLMYRNKANIDQDWNYLSLLAMIAQAHSELEDYSNAKAYYNKILNIEPDFRWVKNELYPDLLEKMNALK